MSDLTDWAALAGVTGIWLAATALLAFDTLVHRRLDAALFGVWSGVVTTVTGVYHVVCVHDDKRPDAP